MKVKITVTLDIDPESWTTNYGIEGLAAIRADAKYHAENTLREHFNDLGLLLNYSTKDR